MRKRHLFIAAVSAASLVACAKSETKTDSAAPAAAAPAAPAAVTAADLVGTVNGKAMPENSDSVLFTFTCTGTAGSSATKCVTSLTPKDTTTYTYALTGADSVLMTSNPYPAPPPAPAKGAKLIDHVVGHLAGNKWTGTTVTVLASKPDSVVGRGRWEATKTQ